MNDVVGGATCIYNGSGTSTSSGSLTTGTYDLLDRLVMKDVIPAVGNGVSDDTTLETFDYDGLSRLVSATDDDSVVTRSHDSLGHVTRETLNGQT